jgi:hypothetical protein
MEKRQDPQRIILTPAEKSELLRIGAEFGHDVDGLMEVAKPATYKRWLAQMRGGRALVLYPDVWKFALGWGFEPLLGHVPAGAAHPDIPWSC